MTADHAEPLPPWTDEGEIGWLKRWQSCLRLISEWWAATLVVAFV